MDRSWRLVALAIVMFSVAAWGVAPLAAQAQSDAIAIEIDFVTEAGVPPQDSVAVLDLSSRILYLNSGVPAGDAIEVAAASGITSNLQMRRTDLQPRDVICEGAQNASVVASSRGAIVAVTPGDDGAVCTVTLVDGGPVPLPDDLAITGTSMTIAAMGVLLLGYGAFLAAVGRSTRD